MLTDGPHHPKVLQFSEALNLELYSAVGLLELLWHFTRKYSPSGDIGRHPDSSIARFLHWKGKPDRLVAALVQCRLLDTHRKHRLVVHNWANHCDSYVHMKLAKKRLYFVDGQRPELGKCKFTKQVRLAIEEDYDQLDGSRRRAAPPIADSPRPANFFDEFWQQYPKKKHKARAEKAWAELEPDDTLASEIIDALLLWNQYGAWSDDPKMVPYPYNWIAERRWEDEIEKPEGLYEQRDITDEDLDFLRKKDKPNDEL